MAERVFEIVAKRKSDSKPLAHLFYDESSDMKRISINPEAPFEDLPLMLELFAERGELEVSDTWTSRWIEERIPPPGRQNIDEILRANKLDDYN